METHNEPEQLSSLEDSAPEYFEPSAKQKELIAFVVEHTDRWRDYRDQNYLDDWERYERTFRGQWKDSDKTRQSERSRVISPASQQAVETRHAEVMESIFGQGEFFDISDDVQDKDNIDVGMLKKQLNEDFKRDKIRKSFDEIELMSEIYGTGIAEIIVRSEKTFYPAMQPMGDGTFAYGSMEADRIAVKLKPVNPKNFLWDPNGTSVDDCMGVAIEQFTSMHKVAEGISSGKYNNINLTSMDSDEKLEASQERHNYSDEKVKILKYFGLVPRELLMDEEVEELFEKEETEVEEYGDMVEAIIVIANDGMLLKAEENPYMMKDRPVLTYQDDTVPGRLMGRGVMEKAFNMQSAIDGSMRLHLDSLALTGAPMMGVDATRVPRGMKFEIQPGKSLMVNGRPSEIMEPMKFGVTDGMAMETSREFERQLLMATNTVDSGGQVTQVSRDASGIDMSTATMIKKNKRAIVNRQEDFIIPFVNKAAWRYMQFDPERYPSIDVKFVPTATLGIVAREYEQKQLAFLIQTLGKDSPLAAPLLAATVKNTSLADREEIAQQLVDSNKPDPQKQKMELIQFQKQMELLQAQINDLNSKAQSSQADAAKTTVEAQLAPEETKAKVLSAISRNLPNEDDQANREFDRRVKIADLLLKEKDIESNEAIAKAQMASKKAAEDYLKKAETL